MDVIMNSKRLKVLLITETSVYAEYINGILKNSGKNHFEIITVDNFNAAYENLSKNHFDVILIELAFKHQNTLNTIKKLHAVFPELAILVIANSFDENVLKALTYGAQDFLIKGEYHARALEKSIFYTFKKKELGLNLEKIIDEKIIDEKIIDEKDTKKLIENLTFVLQELRVHHIELEMQNEELRKTWDELEESRSEYQDLYDYAPIGILSIDEKGLIINANLTSADMLNIERNKLIKRAFILLLSNESRRKFHQHLTEVNETRTKQQCQLEIIRNDGTTFNAALETTPLLKENGYSNELRIALSDITEQKIAELAKAKLASLVNSSTDGIVEIDLNGCILSWNQGASKIYGYSESEILGKSVFKLVPADRKDEMNGLMENLRKGTGVNNFETVRLNKSGQEIDISLTLSPIKDTQGKIMSASAIIRDISDKKKIEMELVAYRKTLEEQVRERTEELVDANERLKTLISEHEKSGIKLVNLVDELKRSNKELEQFAYVASHDLQEPLRMVSSFTQLLERQYKDKLDADADEYINYAVNGAKRMQLLINDLLAFSRVATRGEEFAEVDINEVLEQAIFDLEIAIEENNVIVTNDTMPIICADHSQMVQLFQNLIGNAIKYHSEKTPRINISAKEEEGEWVFLVSDNGIGIDPEYHERIFQIFQRLHEIHVYSGTGIGLAICKKIVERHGGCIWVDSEIGEGATFYFSIPKR